ncbi:MAG: hypothetical protein U0791_10630 [Gemmataceae bacterium]
MFQQPPAQVLPLWNPDTRELTLEGVLVKRFRTSAISQVIILEAFQRQGWKASLANPFSRERGDRDPKDRLHDGLINLNRHQVNNLLRFERNGAGRITWHRIEPPPALDYYSPS